MQRVTDADEQADEQSDIFEWHCTMRGVAGSEYEGGTSVSPQSVA